ncbi:peptide chain release factor N(5)-glutamine methyltransferase [Candidatus Finniella inopinata]|uniref:peptide chain release factor N(5)-glutamine methyltransferase n=1 Tax=Candidatus Finniella inopinata TaxID=1696036 RepID=UPI0013EEE2ED|nr:peptide chain release factor N(5)-glutamine methyltransferase [Candidatus Finniella inopinata]
MRAFSKDLQTLISQLQAAGIDNPRRELTLLIAFLQNRSYTDVFFEPAISGEDFDRLVPLVQRRCNNEPLSKIIGQREFWSLPFKVTADTLDPRPDSETLIQAVLEHFPDHDIPLTIIDFGTGTGCLFLSLLSEYPNSLGVGVDISDAALAVAQQNAGRLGLDQRASFIKGNWAEGMQGTFDVLISNPPYIGLNDLLEDSVKQYDPHQALYAGEDGLAAYRALLPQLPALMHPYSLAFLEIGLGQGDTVRWVAKQAGLVFLATYPDLSGIERVVVFGKSGPGH